MRFDLGKDSPFRKRNWVNPKVLDKSPASNECSETTDGNFFTKISKMKGLISSENESSLTPLLLFHT
jgi:hypothetical protein